MLQHLFFLMSLVVLETEEKFFQRSPFITLEAASAASHQNSVWSQNKTLARKYMASSKPSKETWKNLIPSKFSQSPKCTERVSGHFVTLLQMYVEQQKAVLLYMYI